MARQYTPSMITANDLLSGEVVYWQAKGAWSSRLNEATVFIDESSAQDALSVAEEQVDRVVGVYLVEAKISPNGAEAAHFREGFRAKGPSNYFHGKQAETHQ